MLRSVFAKYLHDNLRGIIGWGAAIVVVVALYSSFYPSMSGNGVMTALADAKASGMSNSMLKAFNMTNLSSPEGYLNATVFSLLVPILMIIAGVVVGTRAIAGDEEEGGLELVLTHPVGRVRFLLERAAALVVFLAYLGALVFLTLLVIGPPLDLGVGLLNLLAACIAVTLIAIAYGSVALAVGAYTGRRSYALGAAALLAVLGYLGNTFALQVAELEWLRFLSAFYYGLEPNPVANGFDAGFTAVLIAVPAVLIALAVGTFTQRDVAV